MTDPTGVLWRKSSRSGAGDCVEVAHDLSGVVGVRDSKDPSGPVLTFTPAAWAGFVSATAAGMVTARYRG
ncbi:DUF397 domain-containing protein [Micromonospora sp. NBC_01699]|uniref:DUF397 domain-containing protein n=1 Tax=Micromonospora sp. NBC_01699 TaxID=2975984 RepID=UPI002E36743F|nr:DUF397 domain-containing protein [Micromonospora sp. NBC_01699]